MTRKNYNEMTPEEKHLDSVVVTVPMAIEEIKYFVEEMDKMYKKGDRFNARMAILANSIIANAERILQAKKEYDKIMAEKEAK